MTPSRFDSTGRGTGRTQTQTVTNPTPTSNPTPNPYPTTTQTTVQPSTSAYRTDLGSEWNPYHYATDETTKNLVNLLGGTATKTAPTSSGPFNIPQQNAIDFGGGFIADAGLTQLFIDTYGLDVAKQMFTDMSKNAIGSTAGIGTDPSFVNYNPQATTPVTANNPNPFTGVSVTQAQQAAQNRSIQNYINQILGGGNQIPQTQTPQTQMPQTQNPQSTNALLTLLSLFTNNPVQQNTDSNLLQTLLTLMGGMRDPYSYSRPRYSLFY
jgi:hypothetical protein